MKKKSIAKTLEEQRVLIFNSSKPEIAPLLAKMGIDNPHLIIGETLYNDVIDISAIQKKESQEKSLAYDLLHGATNECKFDAENDFEIIKMASRNDENLQNRLKIYIPISRRVEEWITQTIEFNNLVLNETDFLKSISKYLITKQSLNKRNKDLEALKTMRNNAMAEKGQAQEATRLRNEKMEELEDYCYELKTIATIALKDQPQLLEMLGILVRS